MWWITVLLVLVIALAVYGFITMARSETRLLSRHTGRRAEDLYDDYADPPRRKSHEPD
jgi:hypothetical protein